MRVVYRHVVGRTGLCGRPPDPVAGAPDRTVFAPGFHPSRTSHPPSSGEVTEHARALAESRAADRAYRKALLPTRVPRGEGPRRRRADHHRAETAGQGCRRPVLLRCTRNQAVAFDRNQECDTLAYSVAIC